MKKIFYSSLFQTLMVSLLMVTVYSCSEDTVTPAAGPDAKSVNGTVNFVDTNFILSGGVYLISAYPTTGWPPTGGPAAYDTISITRTNNTLNKSYSYKLVDLNPGNYVVSVGFRKSTGGQSPIMSVYGCDTARFLNGAGSSCFLAPPKSATIGANNEGVNGINMLSWSDTAKKVY
ncbi:MAG: hypothetical protein JST15_01400 [Bacteroidetes bacterium]|nr:hypothetical protein [Bacteroidota bacterium]